MAKRKTKNTYKRVVHINFTEEQAELMDELGGPTEGFRKLYAFWFQNFQLFEEQERKCVLLKNKLRDLKLL